LDSTDVAQTGLTDKGNIMAAASTINAFTDFVLAELRVASVRASLLTAEADAIGTALRGKFITTDDAIVWALDAGITLPST
jgi:hypothetical protein